MKNIVLGKSKSRKVEIDLKTLLRTRLLIQANSGGGKSWLLRLIAERAFGKVQTIIIDPEGEFATLREKYDYVLVGKGGETPADVRSAAMVAHKLLELNASAVCDLYEMKAFDRHRFVKTFLDAMIDAPKKLWHPVLVIVDEAHVFCPESKAGESEATEAMIGLATRGRKRGFCPIFATQRLGKLRKDAAAELTNVLIGQTFIDIDRERAAEVLGIPKSEKIEFFNQMKVVEPGNFWALGRAISKDRILIQVDKVETTHPDLESERQSLEPPPPPDKIKKLLPKLADLPQLAEAKAKSEQELRVEIAKLKRERDAALKSAPARVEMKERIVEKPIILNGALKSLTKLTERLEIASKPFRDFEKNFAAITGFGKQIGATSSELVAAIRQASAPRPAFGARTAPKVVVASIVRRKEKVISGEPDESNEISVPQQRILDALAWLESVRLINPKRTVVAFLAGQSPNSSGYKNNLSALRTGGLVTYLASDSITLTDAGRAQAKPVEVPPSTEDLQKAVLAKLPRPRAAILNNLILAYPGSMNRDELAEKSGQSPNSSGYKNNLSALRSLDVIEYPDADSARALPVLFLD